MSTPELREWARVRQVTLDGADRTLEEILDWDGDVHQQMESKLKEAQHKALALMDAFFIYRTGDGEGISEAVAEMDALTEAAWFLSAIDKALERKREFAYNKVVLFPEEFTGIVTTDIGQQMLTDIDAIITGET